jgi:hypothetical protein
VGEGDVAIRWLASQKRGRRESNDVSVGAKHSMVLAELFICSVMGRLSCAKLTMDADIITGGPDVEGRR